MKAEIFGDIVTPNWVIAEILKTSRVKIGVLDAKAEDGKIKGLLSKDWDAADN